MGAVKLTEDIDVSTLEYLIRLKANNIFWFYCLLRCAKQSPKMAKQCMDEAARWVVYCDLDCSKVNVFSVCKAVNSGLLGETTFDGYVNSLALEVYRKKILDRTDGGKHWA